MIVEGEGDRFETEKNGDEGISRAQSQVGSRSNSLQREIVVKDFVNDVFKKSEEEFENVKKRRETLRKVKTMKVLLDMKMKLQKSLGKIFWKNQEKI